MVHSFTISLNGTECQAFLVADGHGGRASAELVIRFFKPHLIAFLSKFEESTTSSGSIRKALCQTFLSLERSWRLQANHDASGTTLTCLFICPQGPEGSSGTLITTANVGDSESFLDTGMSLMELTHPHNLQMNAAERVRLMSLPGYRVAQLSSNFTGPAEIGERGVGPIRSWLDGSPYGLCVSRSIGDVEGGEGILAFPHISQVLLPPDRACRVVMASDGLWDISTFATAARAGRRATASAAVAIINSHSHFLDDTTCITVDILPHGIRSFVAWLDSPRVQADRPSSTDEGGCMSCFHPVVEAKEPDCSEFSPGSIGHLSFLSKIDTFVAYPDAMSFTGSNLEPQGISIGDITVHGGIAPLNLSPPLEGPPLSPIPPSIASSRSNSIRSGALRSSFRSLSRRLTGRSFYDDDDDSQEAQAWREEEKRDEAEREALTRLRFSFTAANGRKPFQPPGRDFLTQTPSRRMSSRLASGALPVAVSMNDKVNALLETQVSISTSGPLEDKSSRHGTNEYSP